MQPDNTIAAIILAAGTSSRMGNGRHKLLLPLGDRPVLSHTLTVSLASQARPILVVLGHQAEQVHAAIAHHVRQPDVLIVENPDYPQGMSTSIHSGLQALMHSERQASGVLIILGDQPLITSHIIDTLISVHKTTKKPIAAPLYHGKRGNPVLFASSLFAELMQLCGDEGGRSVIERHRYEAITVELGDAIATYDVDTWEAYQQVVAEWQRKQQH